MKELIERLIAQGLSEQQALKAIEVVKDFAKEKFPVFAGAIEKMFDKYKPRDEDDFLDG
jgi:dihydrodipicolinate synthase/N-acetylneuraminate lyase